MRKIIVAAALLFAPPAFAQQPGNQAQYVGQLALSLLNVTGQLDAEIARNRALSEQVAKLQAEVAELKKAPEQPK